MRVGFDAHMVGQRETGNETYALGLLTGFERIGFAADVYLFAGQAARFHRVHRARPAASAVRIPLAMPLMATRDSLDVLHTTYVLPPLLPCRGVVTVHDISFALHPEWFSRRVHSMLSTLVPISMRRAARIIAVSETTKRDIVERYAVPENRITVTYEAPRPAFSTPVDRRPLDPPHFLYVGNVEPRKNLVRLIRALAIVRRRRPDVSLLVAGKAGVGYGDVLHEVRSTGQESAVHFLGYVNDGTLRDLYAGCVALLHPALYEGFGLTPLEAMAQGVPVIASDAASIPEVVGDAACLVPPQETEAWTAAMQQVLDSASLRADLSSRGLRRAARFSWEQCARETVAAYRRALSLPTQLD